VIPLYKRARKLSEKSGLTLAGLKANTIELFTKRDLVIIILFTILGLGGIFAATLINVTAPDSQGAGYLAATSCDESITINKDVVFNSSTKRFEVATISISGVDQRYDTNGINGCGNRVLEMAIPINGVPTYTSWYIPSSSVSGSNIFIYGSDNTGEYQSDSIITPFDLANLSRVAVRLVSEFQNSGCIIGKSAVCPATSPQEISNLYGTTTNGTYYIKVNGVARKVYVLMDPTNADGGGWILMMKGAPGSTSFTYDSPYWTSSATTLNESSLSNDVSEDAKFSVFNDLSVQRLLAVFKAGSASGSYAYVAGTYGIPTGGDIANNAFNGHVWVDTLTTVTTAQSQLTTNNIIYNTAAAIPKTKYAQSSAVDANYVFSREEPVGVYGFNITSCANSQSPLRWGFQWNENAPGNYASCDMWGGIGGTWTSANDSVVWNGSTCPSVCAAPGTSMGHNNLSFQIWGKVAAPSLNGVQSLAATASGSTATLTWTAPSGATPTDYVVQYKTSTESRYTNAKIVTGQSSTSITGLSAATSYNFRVFARTSSNSTSLANATAVTLAIS